MFHWCKKSILPLAALSIAALSPLAGCSSAPTQPTPGSSSTTPPTALPATAPEADRVHAYLEGRYPSSAVRHSFRSPLGQTVDCVDFLAMPGVRAMAARGEPITETPKPPAPRPHLLRDGSTVTDAPQPPPISEGIDEDGHDRLCPEGTVLQIRVTPEDIARAGGFDAYSRSRQKHAPARAPHAAASQGAPPTMWPCQGGEFHQYAHVIGDIVDTTPGVVFGADTMSVYAPPVPQENADHTVGQVWMFGGTYAQDRPTDPPCTAGMDCVQTIEIGYEVQAGDPNAHVITYSTTDGYTAGGIGCFDGEGGSNCPPFVWGSGYPSTVVPGAIIPTQSAPATPPQELSALIIQIAGDYWVQIGVAGHRYYIGYYPGSNFSKPLGTFQVGGEVYDSQNDFTSPPVPMGSGDPAYWGYPWGAYHYGFNAEVWVNGQSTNYWDASSMCASVPPDYA
ncbi:MAG TPA: neprosin family prolyl endopeptidase, partial [Polyangiaceae bacterium]